MSEIAPKPTRSRALLITVSPSTTAGEPSPEPTAADRVEQLLHGRFGFAVDRCEGERATRAGILEQLDAWVARCRRERAEVCLLYYFGHGGRVRFCDRPDLLEHEFGYVTCRHEPAPADQPRRFEAVLGLELSDRLSSLAADQLERSVIAILDCCFAGQMIREARPARTVRIEPTPDWAQELLARRIPTLAVDSHPNIVRLAGSSPKREAFLARKGAGEIGHMTDALLATCEEFGPKLRRLSWDALVRRVRERVFQRVGEGQWVSFAGPRDQLVFSPSRTSLAPTIGVCLDLPARSGWLRAGALQGVEIGDRWAVSSPLPSGESARAEGTVVEVELNRARVEFEDGEQLDALRSNTAELIAARHRLPVRVDDPRLAPPLRRSAWLRPTEQERERFAVCRRDAALELVDTRGAWPTLRWPADAPPESLIELLEDRARTEVLLASLARCRRTSSAPDPTTLPFAWTWGLADDERELPAEHASVGADSRLWFRLESRTRRAQHWYVNLIYVDAHGRPWQLNTRLPEGIELERGDREVLGLRVGVLRQGLRLPWTGPLDPPETATAKLIVLATSLPLELGQLVRSPQDRIGDAFVVQGLEPARTGTRAQRPRRPELIDCWAYQIISFGIHRQRSSE